MKSWKYLVIRLFGKLGIWLMGYLIICPLGVEGQVDLRAEKVILGEGLDLSIIGIPKQDSIGNIWIPTFGEGLIKYDGQKVKFYIYQRNNPNSLHNNRIQ